MLKSCWLAVVLAAICTGCTTMSLRVYTLNQVRSIEEYRINSALDCLASVAASPDTLPSFALLANGTTHIQDMGTANSIALWTRALKGFSTETFGLTASRGSARPVDRRSGILIRSTRRTARPVAGRSPARKPPGASLRDCCSTRRRTTHRWSLISALPTAWRNCRRAGFTSVATRMFRSLRDLQGALRRNLDLG